MYGPRNQNAGRFIVIMIAIGIVAGLVYFIQDNPAASIIVESTATPLPTTATPPTATLEIPEYRLFVPSLGIYTSVVEIFRHNTAWDISFLGNNAGHLEGTASMDTSGNIVLAGHVERADGSRAVFSQLGDLALGELVVLQIPSGERRYQVTEVKTVEPSDLSALYPTTTERITLITCSDYDFVQGTYESRIVVVAERITDL
jgi:LPXTG-site transpeptidase (sortase) family protein